MLETTQLSVSLPVKSFSCSRFSLNHVSSSSSERFSWTPDINRWNKTKEKLLFVFFFVFSIHSSCQANTQLFGSLRVQSSFKIYFHSCFLSSIKLLQFSLCRLFFPSSLTTQASPSARVREGWFKKQVVFAKKKYDQH